MNKIVLIDICVIGIVCFSSCRSTSSPCGLADNLQNNQSTDQQVNVS